jgi:uncharacterized protein (UPF0332 family)
MTEEQLKQEEIEALHELAIEYLEGAKENLANQRYRIATDAAYNAAELAVKGLLLLELDRLPTTHAGVVNRFGELYIKSGRLPKEFSKQLRQGLRYRNLARYDRRAEIGADKANEVIKLAEELVAALDREKQARGSQCENSSST